MATITKITRHRHKEDLFYVFMDNDEKFLVDSDLIVRFGLTKDKEITQDERVELNNQVQIKKGFSLSVNYLSYRMRTEKEVERYLIEKEYTPATIASIIEKLRYYRYLDDQAFAVAYVESKQQNQIKGPKGIEMELRKKGVSPSIIENSVARFSFEKQVKVLNNWITKKHSQQARRSSREWKQKLSQQLYQKGFSWEVIEAAWSECQVESNENDEWEALLYQGEKAKRKYGKYEGFEYKRKMQHYLMRKGFSYDLIDRYLNQEVEN